MYFRERLLVGCAQPSQQLWYRGNLITFTTPVNSTQVTGFTRPGSTESIYVNFCKPETCTKGKQSIPSWTARSSTRLLVTPLFQDLRNRDATSHQALPSF